MLESVSRRMGKALHRWLSCHKLAARSHVTISLKNGFDLHTYFRSEFYHARSIPGDTKLWTHTTETNIGDSDIFIRVFVTNIKCIGV